MTLLIYRPDRSADVLGRQQLRLLGPWAPYQSAPDHSRRHAYDRLGDPHAFPQPSAGLALKRQRRFDVAHSLSLYGIST